MSYCLATIILSEYLLKRFHTIDKKDTIYETASIKKTLTKSLFVQFLGCGLGSEKF